VATLDTKQGNAMFKLVRFSCGKYGVVVAATINNDFPGFVSYSGFTFYNTQDVTKYCKMYHWRAKRLMRSLDITFTVIH